MAFGITDTGFNRKRQADIQTEIRETIKATLGQGANLLPEAVLGQLIGIFSERESLIWDAMEAVYNSQYPSTSEGVSLDRVAEIAGISRRTPTESVISSPNQLIFGTGGTLIPLGSILSVNGNSDARFVTLNDVTLVAGADEIQSLAFSATPTSGTFEINIISVFGTITVTASFDDTASTLQTKINSALTGLGFDAGTITASGDIVSGGPVTLTFSGDNGTGFGKRDVPLVTITSNTLSDGGAVTVTPTESTPGVPQGVVGVQAEDTGATIANAGTLTEIETPISGWDASVNLVDATVGQGEESDADFKIRRALQIAQAGAATPNAVFADVLDVDDVTAAVVFFNNLAIIDLDGRPPHSVDIVVQGGDEDEIAEAIFDTVGGGITFVGDITKTVKDDQNFDQTIKFSRPTEVDIYLEIDVTTDGVSFPVDGLDQIESVILNTYAPQLGVGDDVIVHGSDPSVESSIRSIPGIVDIVIRVGESVSPSVDDNVDIEAREIAIFDSSRITVTEL